MFKSLFNRHLFSYMVYKYKFEKGPPALRYIEIKLISDCDAYG